MTTTALSMRTDRPFAAIIVARWSSSELFSGTPMWLPAIQAVFRAMQGRQATIARVRSAERTRVVPGAADAGAAGAGGVRVMAPTLPRGPCRHGLPDDPPPPHGGESLGLPGYRRPVFRACGLRG
nr:hypothetical protein OG284_07900 [Streptomyces sp. NBC_01177]